MFEDSEKMKETETQYRKVDNSRERIRVFSEFGFFLVYFEQISYINSVA